MQIVEYFPARGEKLQLYQQQIKIIRIYNLSVHFHYIVKMICRQTKTLHRIR